MRLKIPDHFEVERPPPSWGDVRHIAAPEQRKPDYADNEELKRLYGIELAKVGTEHHDTFAAAMPVFPNNAQACLWASHYWISDPIVCAARDIYKQNAKVKSSLLDKEQYAAKLLAIAEEKTAGGTKYVIEAKDRLVALKMYGEVMGHFPKNDVNSLITNNITKNEMVVRFVEPDKKVDNEKIINHEPKQIEHVDALPLSVKLVG